MTFKKKALPGSIQFNKLANDLPEKRGKIKANIQYRHDLMESQKRVNYMNEFDRLQGAKTLPGLNQNVKNRMKELQSMAEKSLQGNTQRIYSTKFLIYYKIYNGVLP